jgi:hypothetical protein
VMIHAYCEDQAAEDDRRRSETAEGEEKREKRRLRKELRHRAAMR